MLRVSERLWLASIGKEHCDALWHAIDASRESLRPWLPWVDATREPGDCEVFVTAAMAERRLGSARHFVLLEDDELIGVVGFNRIVERHRWASLGYWLRSDRQGGGRMSQSVATLVEWGFDELELHRLEIRCAEGNSRSRAIPERLGFQQEGVLRECEWVGGRALSHVVYSRLAGDPAPG